MSAEIVRFDRLVDGKNLSDLARRVSVSARTLSRLRDGEFSPTPRTRRAITEALHAPAGVVFVFSADVVEES